jgi:hydrocephalus-inducing protein
VNEKEKY